MVKVGKLNNLHMVPPPPSIIVQNKVVLEGSLTQGATPYSFKILESIKAFLNIAFYHVYYFPLFS